ncbi:2-keto-4-pentenoate hydratase [Microvirga massiliensis]|uniref:2-keto-4-pentenoate hydratase n=1 Tax=Microvirga massiliensis TaxID=1033741 RepID=UPI00062B4D45|nr:fumarylacetoacetate hydrolase family protein [Microvirga massiliensis]
MLGPDQTLAASALLFDHWQNGRRLQALPPDLRPATRAEGYAIQAHLEERSASPVFGWKIAATSRAGQVHIGVDGPMAGRILLERVIESGAAVPLGANHMRVAEIEFAFRMGRDLPPRSTSYAPQEVLAAVDSLHPAIELSDSRFEDFATVGAPQLISDNACAHLFVLGPPSTAEWRTIDLAEHKVLGRVAGRFEREGKGANVLDDPRLALAWLANELSQLGITLKAGQVVTTGTCTVPIEITGGDEVFGSLGILGEVSVRIL